MRVTTEPLGHAPPRATNSGPNCTCAAFAARGNASKSSVIYRFFLILLNDDGGAMVRLQNVRHVRRACLAERVVHILSTFQLGGHRGDGDAHGRARIVREPYGFSAREPSPFRCKAYIGIRDSDIKWFLRLDGGRI